jgi:ribosome-binding protein aMBF1 (putative translation factor)
MKFNEEKLAKMKRADDLFDERYGKPGTPGRAEFEAKAKAWYYAEILKETRQKEKITQKQLAEKIGKKREYVALLERGETDMQLSTFINISEALGLKFALM